MGLIKNGHRLVVACKGETSTGGQHARSWINVVSAILTSLNEVYYPDSDNDVAIALPDTVECRGRLSFPNEFFEREFIAVFLNFTRRTCGEGVDYAFIVNFSIQIRYFDRLASSATFFRLSAFYAEISGWYTSQKF